MSLAKLQELRLEYLLSVAEAKDCLKEGRLNDYVEKVKHCEELSLIAREVNLAFCN